MANDIKNLKKASREKKYEFYTQLEDIEKELRYYKDQFNGKVVYCNCDDPFESNFFKFFALKFNEWNLKQLICTCYDDSPVAGEQLSLFETNVDTKNIKDKHAYKLVLNEVKDFNGDGLDEDDIKTLIKNSNNILTLLDGDGDFRSEECIELLKQSDIIVTNPPFGLFREYVAQLMKYEKKFLIIGSQNALTYKDIFPYVRYNKMWFGLTMNGSNRYFRVPDYYELTESTGKIENGIKYLC